LTTGVLDHAEDRVDLDLVKVDGIFRLGDLSAEEELVKGSVVGDGLEQFADSHASCQGFEIEVREDLHE